MKIVLYSPIRAPGALVMCCRILLFGSWKNHCRFFWGRVLFNGIILHNFALIIYFNATDEMNRQQLKRGFERFKRWVRRSPTFHIKSEEEHCCQCCGSHYRGNYCPRCAQKAGLGRITWRSVRNDVMDVWGLGSRSMTLSFWQLLYRPGYFISDYIGGKRQLSFPPVKMLFIITMIYANVFFWFLPEVLNLPLDAQGDVEYKLWIRQHYSWAMLVMSILAIFPTWVIFRNSPRNTHHTLPEGFFIQVLLQTLTIVLSLLTIPLDFFQSKFSTAIYELLIMAYFFVSYKQLFGFGIWGTLWRQALVTLCVTLSFMLLIWIFFPSMMDTVKEALDIVSYFTEYIL